MSSEAYERERQNNAQLDALASKASALRGITVDIYDNARNHDLIDANNEQFTSFGAGLGQSATRLTRMAASGNKIAIFKLAGILVVSIVILYWIKKLVFG
ncbi:hypothetical protein BT63DRAFT_424008 [Microthyrium microscopicum]|uniref:Uncharacterized protein n=1 Tax=Microthyrium microscopicum TaxID=703497 RepID=A0A6A6UCQ0_9PEZI|nr:hypothetical protein BT63DRAFT_424008 [Microthyrium microscopicum]